MELSVIIPVLDEAIGLAEALALLPAERLREVLVVDGGSRDGSAESARRFADTPAGRRRRIEILQAERGRAVQMNAGGHRARGEVLLFLHADTWLPEGAIEAIERALRRPGVVGGAFRHAFRESGPGLRLVSLASNLRSRLGGALYGDQAIFVRRQVFLDLGGFRRMPVFEDADFSRRMRSFGRTVVLPLAVRTSGRRFLHGGVGRTACRMLWMKLAYLGGRDPGRLVGDYWDEARRGDWPRGTG